MKAIYPKVVSHKQHMCVSMYTYTYPYSTYGGSKVQSGAYYTFMDLEH